MIRVLLTNDDGLDAPGLTALERAFGEVPAIETWVIAPDAERSACSHGMTLDRPLFVKERGLRRLAVSGTPADCVYFALFGKLSPKPHLVISGINSGPNLGNDVIYSGTVAGAREAVVRGVHGISVSRVAGGSFSEIASNVVRIAQKVALLEGEPILLNLNYPGPQFKGPQAALLGDRIYPEIVTPRIAPLTKDSYYWLGGPPVLDHETPGTDGYLVANGIASATILTLNQTSFEKSRDEALAPLLDVKEEQ